MDTGTVVDRLIEVGFPEQRALETSKNELLAAQILQLLDELRREKLAAEADTSVSRDEALLVYHVATKFRDDCKSFTSYIIPYVATGAVHSELQVNAAATFLKAFHSNCEIDRTAFEAASGIGVKVTPEEVEEAVEKAINKYREQIVERRYGFKVGILVGEVRRLLPWAETKPVRGEIDVQMFDLLGPKGEQDRTPPRRGESKPNDKETKGGSKEKSKPEVDGEAVGGGWSSDMAGEALSFHAVGENFRTEGYVLTPSTHRLLADHVAAVDGRVHTRFPPEPNGILHIGHAKAINFNFGYAAANRGVCYLRYDDTNPEKEEERFFRGIREMVEWLGYSPFRVTHASDYFPQLYDYAVELIRRGHAYVCHQKHDELKGHNPEASPWRDRPVAESLGLFADMRDGKMAEGDATLRMKHVMEDGKTDPVAYRIKYTTHAASGDRWCVYPTYDFTHCICDSLENITHSLCTKEFQARRSSYYWLCNALDIYCPVQWEYGRLNLNYTVVSKRKIGRLIAAGLVEGWDDPRLFTLTALRRRGYPPEAINLFCAKVGVTMAQVSLEPEMLESCVRSVLNDTASRVGATLRPLRVRINNLPVGLPSISVPNVPHIESKGTHEISLTPIVYIERDDFKEEADKGYRRLTLSQSVGLKHSGFVIRVVEVERSESGQVCGLVASCEPLGPDNKPRGFVQWVGEDRLDCEVRLYRRLFKHKHPEDPKEAPGGFLSDCDPDSREVVRGYVEPSVSGARPYDKFQFERVGYFSVDPDSTDSHLVFNLTVSLKEDSGKSS